MYHIYKKQIKFFSFLFLSIYFFYAIYPIFTSKQDLHDFKIYYKAVKVFNSGGNPYDRRELYSSTNVNKKMLPFVYPPITILFFEPLVFFTFKNSTIIFNILKIIAFIVLFLIWSKYFLKEYSPIFFFFILFAFNSPFFIDFAVGNISVFEQLMLWSAFVFLIKKKYIIYSLVIILLSTFKITPIIFLFLLLFFDPKKNIYIFSYSLMLFITMIGLGFVLKPKFLHSFLTNFSLIKFIGIINPSLYSLSIYFNDILSKMGFIRELSIIIYIFLLLVILITFFYILIKKFESMSSAYIYLKNKPIQIIILTTLLYIIILPRVPDYSFTLAILPAFYVIKRKRQSFVPLLILFVLQIQNIRIPGAKIFFNLLYSHLPLFLCIGSLYLLISEYEKVNDE